MMGTKIRSFEPLPPDVSLEELLPKDNFYRRLEKRLNLSFVREMVVPLYSRDGRPSVDPEVFFKLQLVMFFENVRSERRLMRVVADRISVRLLFAKPCYQEQRGTGRSDRPGTPGRGRGARDGPRLRLRPGQTRLPRSGDGIRKAIKG